MTMQASARSYSNIAFIKYWGNKDEGLRLPANGSISMNLNGIETVTSVNFGPALQKDTLTLNSNPAAPDQLQRVSRHLDAIRARAEVDHSAEIVSRNNFPAGAGIASSASAFSALTVAASAALKLDLEEQELSALSRLGSGSACRSIPEGYVEWIAGEDHESSYAISIAPPEHWDLVDLVAIVSREHKPIGSTTGHRLAWSSPLQQARVIDAPRRLDICRAAILARDFPVFAEIIEQDALMMHSVMLTSNPSLVYWAPPTLTMIKAVPQWRADGIPVSFTIDAGPNVHVITTSEYVPVVRQFLKDLDGISEILAAGVGGKAHLIQPAADGASL
nr:diphosphomevalonate decarboxylase [Anaerolineae bacterium]